MIEKPREFWFEYMSESNEYQQLSTRPPYVRDSSFELMHVIEYSAYEELKAKLETAREALRFECGNRCAEQNPCNAKEALKEIEK